MSFYIIIRGPLGCGKSTISERIAKILKAKYFAVDRYLDKHNLTEDKEEGYISQKSFFKVNEVISKEAKPLLKKGKPIVFDGNFYWKSVLDDLISKIKSPHYVFTLKAPLRVCIERDSKRDKTHGKDAAQAVYKKSTSFTYGTTIDTEGKTPEQTVKEILKHIKT
jgi:broad-specificity NMP kinase